MTETLAVEVVGPPGAGKSTLLAGAAREGIVPTTNYRSFTRMPSFARSHRSLQPLLSEARSRRLSRKERNLMIRLGATRKVLQREASRGSRVVVFDQGPLYSLAKLRGAVAHRPMSERFGAWLEETLRLWGTTLDLVISLDAPDDVLLQRIRTRSKRHVFGDLPEMDARAAIANDRVLIDGVIADAVHGGGLQVIRFDTDRQPIEEVVTQILAILGLETAT